MRKKTQEKHRWVSLQSPGSLISSTRASQRTVLSVQECTSTISSNCSNDGGGLEVVWGSLGQQHGVEIQQWGRE